MIKEAINRILELAAIQKLTFGGRDYTSKALMPVHDPSPVQLGIDTLTGLIYYLDADIDLLGPPAGLMIHVVDFQTVRLLSALDGIWATRKHYIEASAAPLKFNFDNFYNVESFNIALQSMFVQDESTEAILKIVGNLKDGTVNTFSDDGVSQTVNAKSGVSRVVEMPVPNPVTLRPYRTFMEIEQPASKFVFRMRSGAESPTCALFEADGGRWKNDAAFAIKEWLTGKVKGIPIIA